MSLGLRLCVTLHQIYYNKIFFYILKKSTLISVEAIKRMYIKYIKMPIHRKQKGIFPESLLTEIQN